MKENNYKNINGLLEAYIELLDEQIELPVLIQKEKEKFNLNITEQTHAVYKPKEANEMFRLFLQIDKHEDRKTEIKAEIEAAEKYLKRFLGYLKGGKIAYQKKDDHEKSKITFLFWLENGQLITNR